MSAILAIFFVFWNYGKMVTVFPGKMRVPGRTMLHNRKNLLVILLVMIDSCQSFFNFEPSSSSSTTEVNNQTGNGNEDFRFSPKNISPIDDVTQRSSSISSTQINLTATGFIPTLNDKENEEEAKVEELLPQPKARISRKTDKGKEP